LHAVQAYERLIGCWSRSAAPAFVEFAHAGDAQRVLDLGCGTGALTGALVDRWPQAAITGIDLRPDYLQACRAAWPDPPRFFVQGDVMDLPFGDGHFDAALSMLLLMLVPDPARVLAETRRVLRPGGSAAAATWDDARFDLIREFWQEARALDPQAPVAEGRRHCVSAGALQQLWRAAGFGRVVEGRIDLEMRFDDIDAIWSALAAGVGPAGAYASALPADRRDALRQRLERRWSPRRRPGLRFGAALLVVRGERSAG
jgi:SAM-dependent methyltransferase